MTRVLNFSAGPAALPLEVLEQIKADLPDWTGNGMSVMELSHRSKAFIAVAEQAEADLRELLAIPDDYAVLFLQGGATLQFAQLPMNLSAPGQTVDYLVTGSWSKKAAKEAGDPAHRPTSWPMAQTATTRMCRRAEVLEAQRRCRVLPLLPERNHRRAGVPCTARCGGRAAGGGHVFDRSCRGRLM